MKKILKVSVVTMALGSYLFAGAMPKSMCDGFYKQFGASQYEKLYVKTNMCDPVAGAPKQGSIDPKSMTAYMKKHKGQSNTFDNPKDIVPIFKINWNDNLDVVINKLCNLKGVSELKTDHNVISCSDTKRVDKYLKFQRISDRNIVDIKGAKYYINMNNSHDGIGSIKALNVNVVGTLSNIEVRMSMESDYSAMQYLNNKKPAGNDVKIYSIVESMYVKPVSGKIKSDTIQKLKGKFKKDYKHLCNDHGMENLLNCEYQYTSILELNQNSLGIALRSDGDFITEKAKGYFNKLQNTFKTKEPENGLDDI